MELFRDLNQEKINRFIISLLLSIFIWGYVTNMHNPLSEKAIYDVPINIVNSENLSTQNLSVQDSQSLTTTVYVEGRFSDIQNIGTKDIDITMDLNDLALKEGANNVVISVKSLNSSIRIIKEKTPLQTKIEITKLLQKEFPVKVNISGSLGENYIVGDSILSKEKVIVSGTKEDLDSISYIAANISISNAIEDVKTTASLNAINRVGDTANNVILKDKEIEITVPIYFSKVVPVKVITKNSLPEGKTLDKHSLDINSIIIVGPKNDLDKITHVNTEEIDLSRRYYDFDKRLYLSYPEGIYSKDKISSVYGSFIVK